MTIVCIHLSDIHIRGESDGVLGRGLDIARCAYALLPAASHVFIVVTGDIAFSGKSAEYVLARAFLESIRDGLTSEKKVPVSFVFAPGNHDCDYARDTTARQVMIDALTGDSPPQVDDTILDVCAPVQASYIQFCESLEVDRKVVGDRLRRVSSFTVDGCSVTFVSLNASWLSTKNDQPGKLFLPTGRYVEDSVDPQALRITLIHHPINWFAQSCYRPLRQHMRKTSDIIMSGHEHEGGVASLDEAESGRTVLVEGCVLQPDSKCHTSEFNIVEVDIRQRKIRLLRYSKATSGYEPSKEGSWLEYRELPPPVLGFAVIQPEFQHRLDDAGGLFLHSAQEKVQLQDVYVYPDLRKMSGVDPVDSVRRVIAGSDRLKSLDFVGPGVLLEGDEKSGVTSLLYQLYREYHSQGCAPVLLSGADLRKFTDLDLDKVISRAVESQYGQSSIEAYRQLERAKKPILVDDFDESPVRSAVAQAQLLKGLVDRAKCIIVGVSEVFEARELLSAGSSQELLLLDHYQLQPFGYARRSQLIEKWCGLGRESIADDGMFIARCDAAERHIDSVMSRMLIPSYPLYLLILLQSIDTGRSGEFKDTALGYYYQFLLTQAFEISGVRPDKLTETFQYASILAWEYHQSGKRTLLESELRSFNQQFSAVWHTVEFQSRLALLLRARILHQVGDGYEFRYPYVYYFLKGKYLGEKLGEPQIRAYVEQCCRHLYVRDNANTVLFLAHHVNDDFLIDAISAALHGLFVARKPLEFGVDTIRLASWIGNAPKLTFSGGAPADNRRRSNEIKDELDDGSDGLADVQEDGAELSLVAQVVMVLKTTEILGQLLKNKYAKIVRSKKSVLIEELFSAPLRALQDFFAFMERNPDSLVVEIENALKQRGEIKDGEQRKSIARQVVARTVHFLTFGFVMHAVRSANSSSLAEDVDGVVKKSPTIAFRLIGVGILLDGAGPIPRKLLNDLYVEAEKDPIARRVMEMMVIRRLYMFKTKEADMQWLSEKLSISIKAQHLIAYTDGSKRFTK